MKKLVRPANKEDLDKIYLMGFDVWSDGNSKNAYLDECRSSQKYAKGTWYVLEEKSQLVCSLIVYNLGKNIFGIGSIATPKEHRKRGFASTLISEVLLKIENENPEAIIFLYSDIQPEFYEKFGFIKIQKDFQRYQTTTCMVLRATDQMFKDKEDTPLYF